MKKLIAFLLAGVMILSLMTTVSFAATPKPAEIHPELASVKVTCSGAPYDLYYFEDLTQALIEWVCLTLPGEKVITLLHDTELFTLTASSVYLTIPAESGEWYGKTAKSPLEQPLVLDLGGNTLSFFGAANLFSMERFGFTLRNGTVIYTNSENKTRSPFCFGTSTGPTATASGKIAYAPELKLENVHIYNLTESGGAIARSYYYDTVISVTDSVLWAKGNKNTVEFNMTKQSSVSKPWNGEYHPQLTVKNSVMGSDSGCFVNAKDGAVVRVENSTVVSGGNPISTVAAEEATYVGAKTEQKNWGMNLRDGRTVTGTGATFGSAPMLLPFTDVKENDWFYGYVSKLHSKKIIAGQTATAFNPNGKLTYGAALKLLTVGLTGSDAGNAASGHWAGNYLSVAKANGWTEIDASKLDQPITREAFCEIAAKAAHLTNQSAAGSFTDTNNPAVLALVEAGVINGMSLGVFQPQGILTRAQISKIISLLLEV